MTRQQLKALMDYIDARIDEKIDDAFGRCGNRLAMYECLKDLKQAFGLGTNEEE